MPGLYRKTFGARIVQSFYDYDTKMIGPYCIPIEIQYDSQACQGNSFSWYKYYELFNKYEDALAIFNNNNYCFVLLTKTQVLFLPYSQSDIRYRKQKLPKFDLVTPLDMPRYNHVGWIKTYQDCKAVYTWPWKLIADADTWIIDEFNCKLEGEPLLNPPLSLYKSLIDTEYSAVYFDVSRNMPVFI